jgi:hypothetical protein
MHSRPSRSRRSATRPIELDIRARLHLANSRITAHGAPDLLLELAGRDVVAEEGVVCSHTSATVPIYHHPQHDLQHTKRPGQPRLSAQ